jgi:hypothetical protein
MWTIGRSGRVPSANADGAYATLRGTNDNAQNALILAIETTIPSSPRGRPLGRRASNKSRARAICHADEHKDQDLDDTKKRRK